MISTNEWSNVYTLSVHYFHIGWFYCEWAVFFISSECFTFLWIPRHCNKQEINTSLVWIPSYLITYFISIRFYHPWIVPCLAYSLVCLIDHSNLNGNWKNVIFSLEFFYLSPFLLRTDESVRKWFRKSSCNNKKRTSDVS